jgi:Tfp pilus assembly protein PilF
MKYCPSCGKAGIEGMKFCPRCGQRLTGFDLEEKQRYVPKSEAPLKERNWFERHLNWTMVLAWVGAYVVNFIIGFMIASSDPYVSYGELFGIGLIIAVAILAPVWGWTLKKKNRSLWWLPLGLFVPFGFIVLLFLENKSLTHDASGNPIADYNEAIELNPNHADAYYKRGDAYDELGEYEKAIADYNKAIELDPNHALAYLNRGCAYGEIGEYGKAIADYNKVIELRPNHALAYYNRGCAYGEIGDYDKAIADYNITIDRDPDDADAYYSRGLAYRKKCEGPKAASDLEKCIELSTDPELIKDAQKVLSEIKNSP